MTVNTAAGWRRNPVFWLWLRRLIWLLACVPFVLQVQGAVLNTLGADPAKELALDTGRWTLRFMLMSLTITPLRELAGLPGVAPLRRTLGLFALFYASLHFLVYMVFLLELRWSEIGGDILERPYITVGFIAFLILLAMGATSPGAWYESSDGTGNHCTDWFTSQAFLLFCT